MAPVSELAQTNAAILAIYGADDARVTAEAPEVEAALVAAEKRHEIVVYPGAGHAFFFNFGMSYRPEAAQDAWRRTLAWFAEYLC
jgi:carboxymethylenebutenolidase